MPIDWIFHLKELLIDQWSTMHFGRTQGRIHKLKCQSSCDRLWSRWDSISYQEKADFNLDLNWNLFCLNYLTRSLTSASNFGHNLADEMFRKNNFVQEGNRSHCSVTFNDKIGFPFNTWLELFCFSNNTFFVLLKL